MAGEVSDLTYVVLYRCPWLTNVAAGAIINAPQTNLTREAKRRDRGKTNYNHGQEQDP